MKQSKKKKATSLISGVIAEARSGTYKRKKTEKGGESDSSIRAFKFRIGMDRALLEARGRLSTSEVSAFFKETNRLTSLEITRFRDVPVGFSHLRYLHSGPEKSLKFELSWLAERVCSSALALNEFIVARSEIEQFILVGNFSRAEEVLTRLEAEAGSSLWSTSLRIALSQELFGDEGPKQLSLDIRKSYPKGILPFLTRTWSQRAERSVPIGWYLENATRRLGAMTDGEVKTYLTHKILGDWPQSQKAVSAILRVEQSHHLFDMYETLVSALQHLSINPPDRAIRTHVAGSLERMQAIKDFRLAKLATTLGISSWPHQAIVAQTDVTDLLCSGKITSAYALDRRNSKKQLRSGFTCIVRSLILSTAIRPRITKGHPLALESRISLGLIAQADPLRFAIDTDIDAAKKIGHLYSAIPSGVSARLVHAALTSSSATGHFSLLRHAALNFEHDSFIDVAVNAENRGISLAHLERIPNSITRSLACIFSGDFNRKDKSLESSAASYAATCAAHQASNYDLVELEVSNALQSRSILVSNAATTLALSAYGANGRLASAAALISTELAIKGRSPDSLPIKVALDQLKWPDVAPYAMDIAMSNAFAALYDIDPTDETRTIRTFALQRALKQLGINRPSEVRDIAKATRTAEFVYFLYRACSTDVLDMISCLTSSRAVLGNL